MTRKRKKKDKQGKYRIYIVCEGTNTEPNYFKEIADKPEVFKSFAITIYPSEEETNEGLDNRGESIKTDAKNLVKIAREAIGDYDEVWAVFDKDGYTKHEEAFENANKPAPDEKVVNIAFSSIAIENWILLHYEKNKTAFNKSKDVINYLSDQDYFLDDPKDSETLIYAQLEEKTETAIQNAAWLRMEMEAELEANDGKIYELNPYVTVDKLVTKLLNFNRFTYGKIGETVTAADMSIQINSFQWKESLLTLDLTITNHQDIRYLVNKSNQDFQVTDEEGNSFPVAINASTIIDPSSEKRIVLSFSVSNDIDNLRFNFFPPTKGDRHQIIVHLRKEPEFS